MVGLRTVWSGVRNSVEATFSLPVPDRPKGNPVSCKMGTEKLTWGHSGLGMALTTHLISVQLKESLAPYLYNPLRLHGVS